MGGRKVVEREQFVAVARQAGGGLGVFVVVALDPLVDADLNSQKAPIENPHFQAVVDQPKL